MSLPLKTRCRPSKRRRCFSTSQNTSQIQFRTFSRKKIQISWFSWCITREDLFIDVSITNVGLILTKLRWFQLFVKSQIQISNFKKKKKKNKQIFGFPWCSTREDLSNDASITNLGLILTKLWWFLFSGCGQTDGQTGFRNPHNYGNMSAHKKFQLKAQN